jgi:riboflavin synthase
VSLTVAARGADAFEVMLIPETLRVTTLGVRRTGDSVNLEVDLVGRYVVAAVAQREVVA